MGIWRQPTCLGLCQAQYWHLRQNYGKSDSVAQSRQQAKQVMLNSCGWGKLFMRSSQLTP